VCPESWTAIYQTDYSNYTAQRAGTSSVFTVRFRKQKKFKKHERCGIRGSGLGRGSSVRKMKGNSNGPVFCISFLIIFCWFSIRAMATTSKGSLATLAFSKVSGSSSDIIFSNSIRFSSLSAKPNG